MESQNIQQHLKEGYDKEMELIEETARFGERTLWQIFHESNAAEGITGTAWLERFAAVLESLETLLERACVNVNAAFNSHQNSDN